MNWKKIKMWLFTFLVTFAMPLPIKMRPLHSVETSIASVTSSIRTSSSLMFVVQCQDCLLLWGGGQWLWLSCFISEWKCNFTPLCSHKMTRCVSPSIPTVVHPPPRRQIAIRLSSALFFGCTMVASPDSRWGGGVKRRKFRWRILT